MDDEGLLEAPAVSLADQIDARPEVAVDNAAVGRDSCMPARRVTPGDEVGPARQLRCRLHSDRRVRAHEPLPHRRASGRSSPLPRRPVGRSQTLPGFLRRSIRCAVDVCAVYVAHDGPGKKVGCPARFQGVVEDPSVGLPAVLDEGDRRTAELVERRSLVVSSASMWLPAWTGAGGNQDQSQGKDGAVLRRNPQPGRVSRTGSGEEGHFLLRL